MSSVLQLFIMYTCSELLAPPSCLPCLHIHKSCPLSVMVCLFPKLFHQASGNWNLKIKVKMRDGGGEKIFVSYWLLLAIFKFIDKCMLSLSCVSKTCFSEFMQEREETNYMCLCFLLNIWFLICRWSFNLIEMKELVKNKREEDS